MTTKDDWKRAINEHPEHTDQLLIYADWLDENDLPLAEGFRALGQLRVQLWWATGDLCWAIWALGDNWVSLGLPPEVKLPRDWLREIEQSKHVSGRADYAIISKIHQPKNQGPFTLYSALAKAFLKLPAWRRAELLAGQRASV